MPWNAPPAPPLDAPEPVEEAPAEDKASKEKPIVETDEPTTEDVTP